MVRKTKKFSTVDGVCKSLGSRPLPKGGRKVRDMDVLTSQELSTSVVHEYKGQSRANHLLGYTLDVIFNSFKNFKHLDPGSLAVPWNSIPEAMRQELPQPPPGSDEFQLYNHVEKRWNWPLPYKDFDPTLPHSRLSHEQRLAHFYNAISTAAKAQCPDLGISRTKKPREGGTGSLGHAKKVTKKEEGESGVEHKKPGNVEEEDVEEIHRYWMAEWYQNPLPGSEYTRKPDLVLVDNAAISVDEVTWLSPKVVGEFTTEQYLPAGRLGKTMDTKAYLTFLEQPWRRFVLGLSIANLELRVHFYDRSGGAVSIPFNIHDHPERLIYVICALSFGCRSCIGFDLSMEMISLPPALRGDRPLFSHQSTPPPLDPKSFGLDDPPPPKIIAAIGTMTVGDTVYELIDILFSSTSFVGRGTVCYLARHNDVLYIIKDYWVRVSTNRDLLNEIVMMERLSYVTGVPKLHSYSVVQADGADDCTERYREDVWRKGMKARRVHLRIVMTPQARPIKVFRSRRELVSCTRDILRTLESAAENGVLHRDCSLNNIGIEDLADGTSRGLLLDWEFGVSANQDNRYGLGGTGTIPFMSANLLTQIDKIMKQHGPPPENPIRKSASITHEYIEDNSITVRHTHADDIESLFYVFVWIIIHHNGPLGHVRQFAGDSSALLDRWRGEDGLRAASDAKMAFLLSHAREEELKEEISPYFQSLLMLVNDWRKVVAKNLSKDDAVTFSDVLPIFDKYLADSSTVEDPPEMAVILQDLKPWRGRVDDTKDPPAAPIHPNPEPTSTNHDTITPATPIISSDSLLKLTSAKRLRLSDDVRSMDNPPVPRKRFKRM